MVEIAESALTGVLASLIAPFSAVLATSDNVRYVSFVCRFPVGFSMIREIACQLFGTL